VQLLGFFLARFKKTTREISSFCGVLLLRNKLKEK
jgi:hypothetical protein